MYKIFHKIFKNMCLYLNINDIVIILYHNYYFNIFYLFDIFT